jgi:7-hydroxymethyl chlorophyll a reductase
MSKSYDMEPGVHGRHRRLDDDHELRYGVTAATFFARAADPVPGAQWTGVVTRIALAALDQRLVDAVVCVQASPDDPLSPRPVVARSAADVLAARGVKPVLSPTLAVLPTLEALAGEGGGVRSVLFIGVGCQVQAVRAVRPYLDLDNLFILGTPCADNGTRAGLAAFLAAASPVPPGDVARYEFAQDYRVHFVAEGGATVGRVPYFSLPANDLTDAIAPSCYSCFDYANGLADVVVGYMGSPPPPLTRPLDMRAHFQHVTVRNDAGARLLAAAGDALVTSPATSWGAALVAPLVRATVDADDAAKMGRGPDPAPLRVGNIIASLLSWLGPKGLAFGRYSIDYHTLRNYLYVRRHWRARAADAHLPAHAREIVRRYDGGGEMSERVGLATPGPPGARVRE